MFNHRKNLIIGDRKYQKKKNSFIILLIFCFLFFPFLPKPQSVLLSPFPFLLLSNFSSKISCFFIFISHYNLNLFIMDRGQINTWTILFESPFKIFDREDEMQSFFQMIKMTVAPYYKVKSLTTIIIAITIIIYITLAVSYPPFLRVPIFAAQPLLLQPENLKHFEFYRLFTSLFVFQDLKTLVIGCLVIWTFGSYTEQFLGARMFIVFTAFVGLIGYTYFLTLPCFLVGCNFAYALSTWPDPHLPTLQKKMMLVIYLVVGLIYFFIFFSFSWQQKISSYYAAFLGIIMTFVFGLEKDGGNIPTYRKLIQFVSIMVFVLLNSLLIINIIFYRKTFL